MKTPAVSGLLVRFLLIASFGSLVACSPVLQANQLSRSFPRQPAETMADVFPESVPEKAPSMEEARQLDAEAMYGPPHSMAWGYRWAFMVKEGSRDTPGLAKPNNRR